MSDLLTTGRCLCGAVSYRLTGQPLRMAQCHCKACQRSTGTGHISNAFFKEDQLELHGTVTGYGHTADSGNINTRYFCPTCGSRVYNTNSARPGTVGIAVGCADDNEWFSPGAILYCRDRPGWDHTTRDVPNHEAMP